MAKETTRSADPPKRHAPHAGWHANAGHPPAQDAGRKKGQRSGTEPSKRAKGLARPGRGGAGLCAGGLLLGLWGFGFPQGLSSAAVGGVLLRIQRCACLIATTSRRRGSRTKRAPGPRSGAGPGRGASERGEGGKSEPDGAPAQPQREKERAKGPKKKNKPNKKYLFNTTSRSWRGLCSRSGGFGEAAAAAILCAVGARWPRAATRPDRDQMQTRPPKTEYQNSVSTNTTSRSEAGVAGARPSFRPQAERARPATTAERSHSNIRMTRRRGRRSRPRGRGAEPTEPSEARMFEGGEGARQGAGRGPRAPRRGAHYPMQTQSARRLARRMVCPLVCVWLVVLFSHIEAWTMLLVVVVSVAVNFRHSVAVSYGHEC